MCATIRNSYHTPCGLHDGSYMQRRQETRATAVYHNTNQIVELTRHSNESEDSLLNILEACCHQMVVDNGYAQAPVKLVRASCRVLLVFQR